MSYISDKMLDFKSKNRIEMKKNRIRVQSLLRELTADDIDYTRYTKGNRYVTFGFYRYPTLEFIEQTYVYNGGNHRRLMRAKILELIPSTFMQNGRLRKRFVKGVDFIKFEPKPGSVFNVLGEMTRTRFQAIPSSTRKSRNGIVITGTLLLKVMLKVELR